MTQADQLDAEAPALAALVAELSDVRVKGLLRLRDLDLPVLGRAAARWLGRSAAGGVEPSAVIRLLAAAVDRLDGERLQPAARYTFGLAADTRDLPAKDRRERAAEVFKVGEDRFRKHQERLVLRETALAILGLSAAGPQPGGTGRYQVLDQAHGHGQDRGLDHDRGQGRNRDRDQNRGRRPAPAAPAAEPASGAMAIGRRTVPVAFPHSTVPITLHVLAVELLAGVDVLVSSENTYFEMSKTFRSNVSGSLRRAGARKDAAGRILEDLIADQLTVWMRTFGSQGLPVAPGTVVPTAPGELADNGVRRVYHAAVTTPLVGTDDYETTPWVVATAVRRVCALLRTERRETGEPLRSVAFPLLGAGRGGLSARVSTEALLSGLGPALAADPDLSVHLVTRNQRSAAVALDVLEGRYGRPAPAGERQAPTAG